MKKPKKQVRIGWYRRTGRGALRREAGCGDFCLDEVFSGLGRKHDWETEDWPPHKVRITVEYLT